MNDATSVRASAPDRNAASGRTSGHEEGEHLGQDRQERDRQATRRRTAGTAHASSDGSPSSGRDALAARSATWTSRPAGRRARAPGRGRVRIGRGLVRVAACPRPRRYASRRTSISGP